MEEEKKWMKSQKGRKIRDLTGMKFGKLTAIEIAEMHTGRVHWRCRCECGEETIVESSSLVQGCTRSCGCLQAARVKNYYKGRKKAEPKITAIDKSRFDDDWMFAGQWSMPNKPLRTRNGDWI